MSSSNSTCNITGFSGFQIFVSGFISAAVFACGIVLNSLNIYVFTRRSTSGSNLNFYLRCLSIVDLVALTAAITMISTPVFMEITNDVVGQNRINQMITLVYPIGMIAQTASVYLTVCVSAHRLIEVVFPMQKARLCCRTAVNIVISLVSIFAVSFNVPRFFELQVEECWELEKSLIVPTYVRLNSTYIKSYCVWAYTILMLIAPFLLLISFNIRLVYEIRQTERKRYRMERSPSRLYSIVGSSRPTLDHASYRNTSIMLIGISLSFLICNSLALVSNILEMLEISLVYTEVVSVSNVLIALSMSMNTFIYYSFSSKFRRVVKNGRQYVHDCLCYCCCSVDFFVGE